MRYLLAFLLLTSPAFGQPQCVEREDLVAMLKQKYDEVPVGTGIIDTGALLEVFVSPRRTWTVIITRQDYLSCVIAAGESWEAYPVLTGKES